MVLHRAHAWILMLLLLSHGHLAWGQNLTCTESTEQLAWRVVNCVAKVQKSGIVTPQSVDSCFSSAGRVLKTILALAPKESTQFLGDLVKDFGSTVGLQLVWNDKPFSEIFKELKFAVLQNVAALYNMFISQTELIPELTQLGVLADMDPYIQSNVSRGYSQLWPTIHPFFKENMVSSGGRVLGIPFIAYVPYMYWRKDIFRKFNLTVPQTWEEVVQVATFLNNTNWDPRVHKKIPLCFIKPLVTEMGQSAGGHYLLTSILGSMTQYQGKAQGLLYDPLTMEPLVNTTAMQRALSIYYPLVSMMPDQSPSGLGGADYDPVMSMGYCALGFRWTGNLGMSLLPGSTQVWDRANQTLVDCTAELCLGSDPITRTDPATGQNVTRYVNRLSYSSLTSVFGGVNAYSARGYQEAAYIAASYCGQYFLTTRAFIFSPTLSFGPTQAQYLELTPYAISQWPSSYNRTDVATYLQATIAVINHPNSMLDLRMPLQGQIKTVIDDAGRLLQLWGPSAIPKIMSTAYTALAAIPPQLSPGGADAFQNQYWLGIGYSPPVMPPPPTASPPLGPHVPPPAPPIEEESSHNHSKHIGTIVGTSTGVGLAVILCLALLYSIKKRSRYQTLLGRVVAPGVGPLTTLLVTDVQSSTTLWDTLPQDVMESSIALHFSILRRVANLNGGYESATEGDSIILGFHNPASATMAAAESQHELLAGKWHPQLLDHPLCTPLCAVAVDPRWGNEAQEALPQFPLWDQATTTQHSINSTTGYQPAQSRWHVFFSTYCALPGCQSQPKADAQTSCTDMRQHRPRTTYGAMDSLSYGGQTVAEYLRDAYALASKSQSVQSEALYRGLRVRMGLHTGLHDESAVIENVRGNRLQYTGEPLQIATAVCSAGHGGMVLLSGDTFCQLDGPSLVSKGLLLASMGSHQLFDISGATELYQVLSHSLSYRTCFSPPLRYSHQLSAGFLDAPYGRMAICYLNAVGISGLSSWSAEVTQASLTIYQGVACEQLQRHHGYLVNTASGMIVAAFREPHHAIRWALDTVQGCLEADWHPALLEHELGEEVVVGDNTAAADTDSDLLVSPTTPATTPGSHATIAQPPLQTVPSSTGLTEYNPRSSRQSTRTSRFSGHTSRFSARTSRFSTVSRFSDQTARTSERPSSRPSDLGADLRRSQTMVRSIVTKTVLFRGLRLKCAVDVGTAKGVIECSTGRLMYFGRVMNRCARIAGMTKTGQVWASQEAWDAAEPVINSYEEALDQRDQSSQGFAPSSKGSQLFLRASGSKTAMGNIASDPGDRTSMARFCLPPVPATTGSSRRSSLDSITEILRRAGMGSMTRTDEEGSTDDQETASDTSSTTQGPVKPPSTQEPNADEWPAATAAHQPFHVRPLQLPQPGAARVQTLSMSLPGKQETNTATAVDREQFLDLPLPPLTSRTARHGSDRSSGMPRSSPLQAAASGSLKRITQKIRSENSQDHSNVGSVDTPIIAPVKSVHFEVVEDPPEPARQPPRDSAKPLLVAGIKLGQCKLRGVQESLDLVQCRYETHSSLQLSRTDGDTEYSGCSAAHANTDRSTATRAGHFLVHSPSGLTEVRVSNMTYRADNRVSGLTLLHRNPLALITQNSVVNDTETV